MCFSIPFFKYESQTSIQEDLSVLILGRKMGPIKVYLHAQFLNNFHGNALSL